MPLEDYREIIHLCRLCGMCRQSYTTYMPICPSGERFGFDEYFARGFAVIAQNLLSSKLTWSKSLGEVIYKCTMCGACAEQCVVAYKDYMLNVYEAIREELVERGLVPPEVRDFLENVYKYGNPWKEPREKRGEWTEGTEIRPYESGDEFLYYVGCVGSYDTRGKQIAKALGEVLTESGFSFGVLGSCEECDGNEVNMLGEKGLFQLLVEKNIQRFEELGVKKIVTLSPHAYHAMKNEYPQYNGNFEVMHYTQLLREMIENGKLDFIGFDARVTYHDPCFLGRYNEEYEAPRAILRGIPGLEFVEMERNRENSFCCGGGGGNFYMDFLGGDENSPNRIRIREAYNTGAEILAVACPNCLTMLDDAVKAEGLEEKLVIRDVSEIVKESYQTKK